METSQINSVLDIAYSELKNIGDTLPKVHKITIGDAANCLRSAIEKSEAVNVVPHAPYKHTEGSSTQKEIAIRKVKDISDKISSVKEEVADEIKEDLEKAVVFLGVILEKDRVKKDSEAKILAAKEAGKNIAIPETPLKKEEPPVTGPITETPTGPSVEGTGEVKNEELNKGTEPVIE